MGTRWMRSAPGPILMVVAALLVTATAAGTKTVRHSSKVTLAPDKPFHGRVTSKTPACRRGRTVKVFHAPNGLYGTTTTNSQGRWSISAGAPHGNFFARVLKRSEGTAGTIHACKGAKSKTRRFR